MYSKIAILAAIGFTAIRVARAEGLDWDEVPPQCFDACREVVQLSQVCDDQHSDDSAELNCICVGENMDTYIPQCELCARPYFLDGPDDTWDDPFELLGDCAMPALNQDSPPGGGGGTESPSPSPSPAQPAPQPDETPDDVSDDATPPAAPVPPPSPTGAPTDDTPDDTDDDDYATPPPTGATSPPGSSPQTSTPAPYDGAAGAMATPMAGAAVLVALLAL